MSRSRGSLGPITKRVTVDSVPGTLEFRAGAGAVRAADTARPCVVPGLDDVRLTIGPGSFAGAAESAPALVHMMVTPCHSAIERL
jgi:hypothetical protein